MVWQKQDQLAECFQRLPQQFRIKRSSGFQLMRTESSEQLQLTNL